MSSYAPQLDMVEEIITQILEKENIFRCVTSQTGKLKLIPQRKMTVLNVNMVLIRMLLTFPEYILWIPPPPLPIILSQHGG
jgi:hypothetical protein